MVYRPRFVKQWNDPTTTLDWSNCTMASGAMALDYDTLGRIRVLGGQLRKVSGDSSGGSNLRDLERAWAHYGQVLHNESGKPWTEVVASLKGGRGIVLQLLYGSLPRAYRSPLNSPNYTGPHAVYLNPEFDQYGRVLMGDPLNDKFIWVPLHSLKAAAEAFARSVTGTSSPQRIYYARTDAHSAPTLVPYSAEVEVTISSLNVREQPSSSSAKVATLRRGARIRTVVVQKQGGTYVVNGVTRRDWLGFLRNGETDWIARGYTKVVG